MWKTMLLPGAFAALFAGAVALDSLRAQDVASSGAAGRSVFGGPAPAPEPGTFPDQWINGVGCPNEPAIQVHAYNQDLYILRQSKCTTFEAPFLYLVFGEDRALLLDTGATPSSPVKDTVAGVIQAWLAQKGKTSIELVVGHTHNHSDHVQADAQFAGIPGTVVVPQSGPALFDFWGFQDFPNDVVQVDLGNRVLDLIGTPGHQANSITFYDRRTQLLLTGDIVYPGHIFVFSPNDWPVYEASLQRLVAFAAANPVRWVLGCHIEFADQPFAPYAYTTPAHPDEHVLQFPPSILTQMRDAAVGMAGNPRCQVFSEWVVHPVYLCGILWNG